MLSVLTAAVNKSPATGIFFTSQTPLGNPYFAVLVIAVLMVSFALVRFALGNSKPWSSRDFEYRKHLAESVRKSIKKSMKNQK